MQNVQDVFMELSRDLRRLKDLPLFITSLQGTSPTFRYTEVCVYDLKWKHVDTLNVYQYFAGFSFETLEWKIIF